MIRQFTEVGGRPGDERRFFHKKLLSSVLPVATKFLGGAAEGLGTKLFGGGRPPARPTLPRTMTARPSEFSAAGRELGKIAKFANGNGGEKAGCIWPLRRDPRTGACKLFIGERSGPDDVAQPVGDALNGRYGAALTPGVMTIDRSVCLPGMQLGNDGLCYNKGQITNKQRMWPAGRRPLLTGGDMRAISIAASAGRKLERTTKRLQKIGLMKKPASSRRLSPGRGPRVVKEAGAGSVTIQ